MSILPFILPPPQHVELASIKPAAQILICGLLLCACGTATPPPPDHSTPPVVSAKSSASSASPASSVAIVPAPAANSAVADSKPPPANPADEEDSEPEMPKGFVYVGERPSTQCGDFRVEVLAEPNMQYITFMRVNRANGTRAYEAHGRDVNFGTKKEPEFMRSRLYGEFCGDMTGDGIPEIVFSERTMGAHCCYTRYVVSLTDPPKRLLMWEKGDGGTDIRPVKYTQGSLWQLEDRLVFWPPFNVEKGDPALSYASAPLIPVVFSLVNGEFVMASLSFPEAYKKQRDEIRAECARLGGNNCGTEIIEWIDGVAIGDWATESKNIKDADLRATFTRLAAPTKIALTRAVGSLKTPVFTNPKP